MADEEYPPLIRVQAPSTVASRLESRVAELERRSAELERRSNVVVTLLYGSLERDVGIVAGEILKWSVNKRGTFDGEGRHLYDSSEEVRRMVLLGCKAYGQFGSNPNFRDLEAYKSMSQDVIKLRNETAHFENINALESMIRSCQAGIHEWPRLREKFPAQVTIISNYHRFKAFLPENFQ